jgi:hypothetical protein
MARGTCILVLLTIFAAPVFEVLTVIIQHDRKFSGCDPQYILTSDSCFEWQNFNSFQ